jgi:hypothetical protein
MTCARNLKALIVFWVNGWKSCWVFNYCTKFQTICFSLSPLTIYFFRIEFKVLTLTFQAIHGLAPKYLCELIRIKEQPNYHLRSSEEIILAVPSGKSLTTLGNKAFEFAAPRLWNCLPKDMRLFKSICTFKKQLKTYLFRIAYDITY